MKNYSAFLLLLLLAFQACKKSEKEEIQRGPEPLIREIGTAIPGKISKRATIGTEGGKISSTDGGLSLDIPAGAVDLNTIFDIQEVTSTLEGNKYPTYKITPEGIRFKKPVTIKINYQNFDLTGSSSEMLAPTYQDEKGIYHVPKEFLNDKANKTLSISTTHFSSWTAYDKYRLEGPTEVGTKGNIQIKLMTYPQVPDLTGDESLQAWDEAEVTDAFGYVDERLKTAEWKLLGEGVVSSQGLKCLYSAPLTPPASNPVLVSVSMTGKFESNGPATAKYTLLYPIQVVSDEYCLAVIDGVEHQVSSAVIAKFPNSFIISGLVDGKRFLTLTVHGTGKGSYPFGMLASSGEAHLSYGYDGSNFVQSMRSACTTGEPNVVLSPGKVNITSYPQQSGGYVAGTVTGAVLYHQTNYCANQVRKSISMSFSLKAY